MVCKWEEFRRRNYPESEAFPMGLSGSSFSAGRTRLNDQTRAGAPGNFISLSDGITHYEIAGPEDGKPVVLIHGFSVPYHIWDPTFESLVNAGFRTLRYDLLGRGYSERPALAYTRDLFDKQLLELITGLSIEPPVDLVGLSMGGAISVVFTARHPAWVRKLVLIDPAGVPMGSSFATAVVQLPGVGELCMVLLGDWFLLSSLKKDYAEVIDLESYEAKYRAQLRFGGYKRALLSTLRNGLLTGALEEYRQVGIQNRPILLIWGVEDKTVPFELSALVRSLLPEASFHAIDGAAHLPHIEKADHVNPLIVRFLA
jgi:pimeloyl-ACP methyl ester carboxylesterase